MAQMDATAAQPMPTPMDIPTHTSNSSADDCVLKSEVSKRELQRTGRKRVSGCFLHWPEHVCCQRVGLCKHVDKGRTLVEDGRHEDVLCHIPKRGQGIPFKAVLRHGSLWVVFGGEDRHPYIVSPGQGTRWMRTLHCSGQTACVRASPAPQSTTALI